MVAKMSEPTWVYVCETIYHLDSVMDNMDCGVERECLTSIREAADDYIAMAGDDDL